MSRKHILLHTCCAPCVTYVQKILSENYSLTSYFYNPNIAPSDEYALRLNELIKYSVNAGLELVIDEYDTDNWNKHIEEFRFMGERSERCRRCIQYRLDKAFIKAVDLNINCVATVLTISPHKDSEMINTIGKGLEKKYGIEYLEADFKKNDGYKFSVELSKKYEFYRQSYCGCIYSKIEMDNKRKTDSKSSFVSRA